MEDEGSTLPTKARNRKLQNLTPLKMQGSARNTAKPQNNKELRKTERPLDVGVCGRAKLRPPGVRPNHCGLLLNSRRPRTPVTAGSFRGPALREAIIGPPGRHAGEQAVDVWSPPFSPGVELAHRRSRGRPSAPNAICGAQSSCPRARRAPVDLPAPRSWGEAAS